MFMRFLQLKLEHEKIIDFREFYEKEVIRALKDTQGCLYAGLIKLKPAANEFISLTLWKTREQAENYETQGAFKKLFEKAKEFLSDSAEWKIQLSEDMELQYGLFDEEPVIKKYLVTVKDRETEDFRLSSSDMFVRILSMTIQKNKLEEFKILYSDIIIPALKQVKGCRYVFLTESVNHDNEFISVTIWDKKADADEYESSGKFRELTEKVKHTFSHLYLWKMSLEKSNGTKIKTSEDFKLEQYDIVTGHSFL